MACIWKTLGLAQTSRHLDNATMPVKLPTREWFGLVGSTKVGKHFRWGSFVDQARRPNNFPLAGYYINMRADVANDADDTAISYLTMVLNKGGEKDNKIIPSRRAQKVGLSFSE